MTALGPATIDGGGATTSPEKGYTMAWKRTTVTITFDNRTPYSPVETFPSSVNDSGLHVTRVRRERTWQICNVDGLRIVGSLKTKRAACELADMIGPLAPNGWASEAIQNWRQEDPESFLAMRALIPR